MEISVRRAKASDKDAIEQFINDTYGLTAPYKGGKRSEWQFVNNPFKPGDEMDPSVWVAVAGDKVVGQIAVQDGSIHVKGRDIPAGWIVDVMVRPEYRGLGLGHRIHDSIIRERDVLVTLTMALATRKMAERANCLTLGPTQYMISPVKFSARTVSRFVSYKLETRPKLQWLGRIFSASYIGPLIVAGITNFLNFIRRRSDTRLASDKNISSTSQTIEEVDKFPENIDELWEASRDSYPVIFERSVKFLNWRFCKEPNLNYRKFILLRDGVLKGYVITRSGCADELPLGVLVDIYASPKDTAALNHLISHAIEILAPTSEFIEAAASTESYQRALTQHGFIGTRTMAPTVVCDKPEIRSLLEDRCNDWHFTKADHDWDQVHPV